MLRVDYPSQTQEALLPPGALPQFRLTEPELRFPAEVDIAGHFLGRNLAPGQADRVALFCGERSLSYRDLARDVNRFASALAALGVKRGERVLLRIPNCLEFAVCALALHRIGAVVVPTNVLQRAHVVTHVAAATEAAAVIVHATFLGDLEAARPGLSSVRHFVAIGADADALAARGYLPYAQLLESGAEDFEGVKVRLDELATVFFTSGTTGEPKGCMHLAFTLLAGPQLARHMYDGIRPGDVISGTPPLAFTFGYGNLLLFSLLAGVPCVLIEGRATPEAIFETIQRRRVTLFNSVPTAYAQMLAIADAERRYDLSSLRHTVSGSAPLPPGVFREWHRRFGIRMGNGMGSSETYVTIFSRWLADHQPGAMGKPLPGWEIRILDEAGDAVPDGTPGRLAIRGPAGNLYWRNPEAQAEAVSEGWSLTGDLVTRDADGCYWHLCRADDIIKSRGYRVSPAEVEDALARHHTVFEAAVIGAPDPVQGQKVKAFVVLKPGREPSGELALQLREFASTLLAPYQVPAEVGFLEALPRTETGKVRRQSLLEMELALQAGGPNAYPAQRQAS